MPKYVIAALRHETNTFSPVATPLSAFFERFSSGEEDMLQGASAISQFEHTTMPIAAFLQAARARQAQIEVPLYANASPSAPTDRAAFDRMSSAVVDAVGAGCDAVLLDLHGAMVVQGIDDAEGELLTRIRAVAPSVPIAVALDFHSNLGDSFFQAADVVTGYCTYPHIDTFETGERAARSLFNWLDGGPRPHIAWRRLPMLTHMNRQTPASEPMRSIMQRAMTAETSTEVMNASVFGGFPLADVPMAGLLTVVVDGEPARAESLAQSLADMAWQRRADFVYRSEPLSTTVATAGKLTEYPVVLADHGNNCGAGGSVDTMAVYREIQAQGLQGVVGGPVCDPIAVAEGISAGVGTEVSLEVGGRTDLPAVGLHGEPMRLEGRVRAVTDGRFVVTGPMLNGVEVQLGRCIVLDAGWMQLLISERRAEPFDLGVFRHCGLDPCRANYIVVHSRQHFKAGFEPIAKHILLVAGPGVCTSDYDRLAFNHLTRPIYPLDPHTSWP